MMIDFTLTKFWNNSVAEVVPSIVVNWNENAKNPLDALILLSNLHFNRSPKNLFIFIFSTFTATVIYSFYYILKLLIIKGVNSDCLLNEMVHHSKYFLYHIRALL